MVTRKNNRRTPVPSQLRAVGYVRISVDRDEQTSTETQERSIRAFCESQGWPLVELVVERGRSAYKNSRGSRPGFHKAVHLVEAGAANVFVAWKLDRVSRNARDLLNFVHDLEDHAGYFACAGDAAINTTSGTGKVLLPILGAIAEMESDIKADRTSEWHEDRRLKLAPPVGPCPYGYDRDERNRLTINPTEAGVIREVASALLAGDSLRDVTRRLNEAGVRTKSTPAKPGGLPFERRTVKLALIKPVVAGLCELDDGVFVQSDQWECILDREMWEELRSLLLDPARRSGPGNARRWLLSGIARCGREDCVTDQPMFAKPHRSGGTRYTCAGCSMSIEAPRTDDFVTRNLVALLDRETWHGLRVRRDTPSEVSDGFDESMTLLMDRFKAGEIDPLELADLAEGLRRQRDAASSVPLPLPDVSNVAKEWPSLTVDQQRLILVAATASLTILPATPGRNYYDGSRVMFVPSF